jgi:exodeoxyribonuclease VII small subunit
MKDKEKSFEDLMNELDEILKKLNDSKISLDDAVKGYLKGLEVSKACNEILNQNKELVVKKMTAYPSVGMSESIILPKIILNILALKFSLMKGGLMILTLQQYGCLRMEKNPQLSDYRTKNLIICPFRKQV